MNPALAGRSDWRTAIDGFDRVAADNLFLVAGAVQDAVGCVPRSAVVELAKRSGIPQARLWGALTAYPAFELTEE